jgi:hypothetical protein
VLIGFSNGIRGAERLTAPQALGDSDNDMSCHARNYGTGRTRFQLQFPIAVCERLITLPNTVSLVERSNLSCHSGISMQPNSCIYVAIATRLASPRRLHRQSGNGEMPKDMLRKMRLESHAREECSRRSFPRLHLTVRGESLGARIASEGPENRPRCLRRLVQVRSTHKLIRKGVCDEIKLRPGQTNLEPIAR